MPVLYTFVEIIQCRGKESAFEKISNLKHFTRVIINSFKKFLIYMKNITISTQNQAKILYTTIKKELNFNIFLALHYSTFPTTHVTKVHLTYLYIY